MRRGLVVSVAWALSALFAPLRAQDGQLSATAVIEDQQPFVGQTVVFQIQIQGHDAPEKPDVTALRQDFSVREGGGAANNSQSITIVNGRVTRNVQRGYTFQYQLAPKREGRLQIPPITIRAGGLTATTNSIQLQVSPPAEIRDFRLIQTLSKRTVYVGEPVMLTTVWYVGRNVDQFAFTMPVLEDPRFEAFDPRRAGPAGAEMVDIPVGDSRVSARKGQKVLDGYQMVTVEFRKAIVAREAGTFALEPTVVSFRAIRSEARRSRSLFEDFFGESFFGSRRGYENLAIPANRLSLEVLPLPGAGRPPEFSGLIGNFSFTAQATPAEVSVGDPITLTIRVSGPEYLDYVRLPDLGLQPKLAEGFKIPEEMAAGEIVDAAKVFSQTIRAKDSRVDAIPSLDFSYFDPELGEYRVARTEPIPLEVSGTRVLTLSDGETAGPGGVVQAELENAVGGIAHNYEDSDALRDRRGGISRLFDSPLWALALGGPPAAYFGLLALVALRRRRADDPATVAAKAAMHALSTLEPTAEHPFAGDLLEALRRYLRARLALPPGALTFADVEAPLEQHGAPAGALEQLKQVFEVCEGGSLHRRSLAGLHAGQCPCGGARRLPQGRGSPRRPRVRTLLCLLAVFGCAQPGRSELGSEQAQAVFEEANQLFRQAGEETDPRQAFGLYQSAALRYQRLIEEGGIRNEKLYYNLGNAYYRSGDFGRAILSYRRAQALAPADPNVRQNLEAARAARIDRFSEPTQTRVMRTLLFWHYDLSFGMRLTLLGCFAGIFWVLAAVRLVRPAGSASPCSQWRVAWPRRFCCPSSFEGWTAGDADVAVILAGEATARKGDGANYEPAFTEPLHAGARAPGARTPRRVGPGSPP